MKEIDLTIDYDAEGIQLGETPKEKVLIGLLGQAIDSYYGGLECRLGYMAGKIFDKLDKLNGSGVLALEDAEHQFLKDAVEHGKFTVAQNKVACLLYDRFGLTE